MAEQKQFPVWDASKPQESLNSMRQWAIDKARERIEWYSKRSKTRRGLSQWLRILVTVAAGIGALCPLIDATGISLGTKLGLDTPTIGKWGYVLIAFAVSIYGFDKFFGLSTGWMRFIVTQLSLERVLQEFYFDWASLLVQQQGGQATSITPLLERVKEFSLQVENLVKQETDAWVLEFQSNLAELDKVLKTEVETRKLGSIKVTVTNAKDFESVAISLNDSPAKELVGVTEGLIEAVPPRRYEIIAVGTKDNKAHKASRVIEVKPNAMASVEMTLPPG